jgi:hypothetical protein
MPEKAAAELAQAVSEMAGVLDGLRVTAEGLRTEMTAVRHATAEARHASRRTRLYAFIGAGIAGLVLIVVSVGFVVQRQADHETEERREQTQAVLAAIEDCTRPGHPCYDENQRLSNERLAPVVRVICLGVPPEQRTPPCPSE